MNDLMKPSVARKMEKQFALRREAVELLGVIAAEFQTDPLSVQCFDARTVERAIEVSDRLAKLTAELGGL